MENFKITSIGLMSGTSLDDLMCVAPLLIVLTANGHFISMPRAAMAIPKI